MVYDAPGSLLIIQISADSTGAMLFVGKVLQVGGKYALKHPFTSLAVRLSSGVADASHRPCRITARVPYSTSWSLSLDHPVILPAEETAELPGTRAQKLLSALQSRGDQVVEVELGSYDDIPSHGFDKIPMPLWKYLEWLQETPEGTIGGKPLYLAQWVGREQVDAIGAKVPPLLQPLLDSSSIDMYMEATFLGPTGAVTPFHYDAYMNFFHLQAASDHAKFAKHVILVPPFASDMLRHAQRGSSVFSNTSKMKARLCREWSVSSGMQFHVEVHPEVPLNTAEALAQHGMTCILREGETLFIPKGWWHRVENVCLAKEPQPLAGWTAGVSWWFLPRSGSHTRSRSAS